MHLDVDIISKFALPSEVTPAIERLSYPVQYLWHTFCSFSWAARNRTIRIIFLNNKERRQTMYKKSWSPWTDQKELKGYSRMSKSWQVDTRQKSSYSRR